MSLLLRVMQLRFNENCDAPFLTLFLVPNSSLQLRSTEVATKDREEKMITVQSKSFTPFGRQFSGVHPRGGEESLNVYIMLVFAEFVDVM